MNDSFSEVDDGVSDLACLGFSGTFEEHFRSHAVEGSIPARISRVDRGMPLALSEIGTLRVGFSPCLRGAAEKRISTAVVGDWVALVRPEGHEMWMIETVLPRSSAFSRKNPGDGTDQQVVIANVDVIFIVQSLSGDGVNVRRLERELVMAWESGALPVIVLSKADLVDDPERMAWPAREIACGVEVIIESAVTGQGIEDIRRRIPKGHTAALLGGSGVGKSTLINRLLGKEILKTQETRSGDDKGRHTTVAREMVLLADGGVIIDTPGMRGLSLWNSQKGMEAAFPDIVEYEYECRFTDCRHHGEPGCAVILAVETGDLRQARLDSWRRLSAELEELGARQADLARRDEGRRAKSGSRADSPLKKRE